MRLINTTTLKIEDGEFWDSNTQEYVILSHTWGLNEISFEQLQNGILNDKIRNCCALAKRDGFQYAWIDTCCIDKTSSSELSEAINSMYKWYKNAAICYAYLEDMYTQEGYRMKLECCRWFTRGWTLQELIAPSVVEFYDKDWSEIGTKMSMQNILSEITGIPQTVLNSGRQPRTYNVAERMSWASNRETTRKEDEAYCLLGLFNIQMPMLYGEGSNAFQRLQEEIMRLHDDFSLFAWPLPAEAWEDGYAGSLFAKSPAAFSSKLLDYSFSDLIKIPPSTFISKDKTLVPQLALPIMTSRGINITLPIVPISSSKTFVALLCTLPTHRGRVPQRPNLGSPKYFYLVLKSIGENTYIRRGLSGLETRYNQMAREFTVQELVGISNRILTVLRNDEIERRFHSPLPNHDFSVSINLSTSAGYSMEIHRFYQVPNSFALMMGHHPDPLPIPSASLFRSEGRYSGIVVLTLSSTSGAQYKIPILFGQENGLPWCEIKPARSYLGLEKELIEEYGLVDISESTNRTDRCKERIRASSEDRGIRFDAAIRRRGARGGEEENEEFEGAIIRRREPYARGREYKDQRFSLYVSALEDNNIN